MLTGPATKRYSFIPTVCTKTAYWRVDGLKNLSTKTIKGQDRKKIGLVAQWRHAAQPLDAVAVVNNESNPWDFVAAVHSLRADLETLLAEALAGERQPVGQASMSERGVELF